ncbi:Uncharacterised protein [Burkholderia pseudomallei]|nr:Uncharacterised protein [Burkholderia pseudomallei]
MLRGLRSQCRDIGIARVVRDEAFLGRRRSLGRGCIRSCVFRRAIVHRRCRISRKHDHLAHPRHLRQLRLDLPQLDPETAYLHLEVVSTQILQPPVRAPTRQIPRLIQPPARHERIVDEPLPRQLRPVQVPACNARPADVELPAHAHRRRAQPLVQHIGPHVRQRPADVRRMLRRDPRERRIHRAFRRTIHVVVRPARYARQLRPHPFADRLAPHQRHLRIGFVLRPSRPLDQRQLRRRAIEDVDPVSPDRIEQTPPVEAHRLRHHHQRPPRQQLHPLLDQRIERDRCVQAHAPCARVRAVDRLVQRTPQIHHACVLDHHPLRLSRRARRVDHIGKVARRQAFDTRRRRRQRAPARRIRLQVRNRRRTGQRIQRRAPRRVRQHDRRPAVVQDRAQALRRIARVQRHICAARLQDRQQSRHHLDAAPERQPHARVRPDALSAQVVREAIRTRVEVRIAQRLVAADHRRRFRRSRYLGFEQLMEAGIPRIRAACFVPAVQYLCAFGGRQYVKLSQFTARICAQRASQLLQRQFHEFAYALWPNPFTNLRDDREIALVIIHGHAQWITGSLVPVEQFDAVGNMRGRDLRLAVPIVQQRREQRRLRRHPAATLRQHQRRMLVTHQFRQLRMRPLHARLHARLRYPHPHRQRVDEQAQRSIRLRASLHPPEQHRAEHHVLPPRRARQHQPPRHMHHARRAHPQPARMSAKRPRQLRLQPPRRLRYLTPVSLNAQQTERRRRLIDVPQLRPEVRLVVRLAHPQPRLRNEIPERRRPRQVLHSALPDRARLLDHTLERRMIDRQMMKQHARHPAFVLAVASRVNVHQRRAAHVHPIAARIEAGLQLPHDVAFARIELDDANRQRRPALHDLHRLLESLPEKTGAQDVVPIDHLLQCRHKPLHHLAAAERQHARQHVRIAFPRHQVMKQNAFLQRRQRIDVLHVRRSAFHLRHQRVDRLLAQRHQRQLGRRNVLVAVGNQIRRYPDVLIVGPQMRGEIGQRRRPVDDTHVGMQARRPKLLAQADHEQRMPAEFEEIVMAADALHGQQVLPDRGQCFFLCALRRFVFGAGVRVVRRRGQCAPVQLAVRRQRPRVQPHVRRWHHVGRQMSCCLFPQRRNIGIPRVVRDEAFLAGRRTRVARQHHRLAHARHLRQLRLDLP